MKINNRGGRNKGAAMVSEREKIDIIYILERYQTEQEELAALPTGGSAQCRWNARKARNLLRYLKGTHRKCCGPCGRVLEVNPENFYRHWTSALGYQRVCRQCSYGLVKDSLERTREKKKALRDEMNLS